tara:strand:+ start:4100 stop:4594 length:495 start_codon:yes stop_codon:yes gene_type:complete
MYPMKKGAINYIAEIFIGAFILFFIIVSALFFGEISQANADVTVFAISTGFECHNNLNNAFQMTQIFDGEKTTKALAKTTDLKRDLDILQSWLDSKLSKDITLKAYDSCESIIAGCEEGQIATSGNVLSNTESCILPIAREASDNLYIEMKFPAKELSESEVPE